MISIKIPLRIMNLFISKEKFVPQSICLLEGERIETPFGKILSENGSMLLGASLKTNVALKSSILLTTVHIWERHAGSQPSRSHWSLCWAAHISFTCFHLTFVQRKAYSWSWGTPTDLTRPPKFERAEPGLSSITEPGLKQSEVKANLVYKMKRWQIDKMTNRQDDTLTRWQNYKMTKLQDDIWTRWQDDKLTRWQDVVHHRA